MHPPTHPPTHPPHPPTHPPLHPPPNHQAVLLADVDPTVLHPLTYDLPKSLLPLLNRPLLQYQLDLLHASGKGVGGWVGGWMGGRQVNEGIDE